ncbi:MAG TPA: helix-turn-helix domain-containing protein [Thermoanaerobaculia bacterium]|nr:helix-turn-helix domain-containing protein [Thermoanaerobaculia bacterium]
MRDTSQLLDPRATAGLLGVRYATLATWRWRGEGPPYVKVGATVRYRLTDLEAWLAARTRTSTRDDGSGSGTAA